MEHYNKKYHLTPSSPDYWTPERLKAEAMIESGGDKEEFLSDPLQINKEGDYGALRDYNGNNRKYPRDPTEEHKYWYARTILELEEKMNKKRGKQ